MHFPELSESSKQFQDSLSHTFSLCSFLNIMFQVSYPSPVPEGTHVKQMCCNGHKYTPNK
jgi:hypothetical protein